MDIMFPLVARCLVDMDIMLRLGAGLRRFLWSFYARSSNALRLGDDRF